jgi:hypothetical protein
LGKKKQKRDILKNIGQRREGDKKDINLLQRKA